MWDAIVVGARCAGSPTAMLLARRGLRVLLVDRARFPSDVLSAHYVHWSGVERLARWGLLERVVDSGCPPVSRIAVDLGALAFTVDYEGGVVRFGSAATPIAVPPVPAYCPRRHVLDAILVEAAVEAGAELREGYPVHDLVWEDGRVAGLPGERARIVVGADGLHSVVAREVGAPFTRRGPALTCAYHAYFADVPVDGMEFFLREGRAVMAVPTNDGLTLVGAGWPLGEFGALRRDPEGNLLRTLDLFPELGARVRAGRRVGKVVGTAALPNHFRRPYGPGWALVGDAGYHRDPLVGQGISDAFRDAELLAAAVDDGLAGRRPLDDALASYETERDAAALPLYELACRLATLAAPSSSLVRDFARLGAAA